MFEHLRKTPKVHDLVLRFLTDVNAGAYDLSKNLPPVRAIAERYGVSVFTVHRAFDELKKNGVVRAEGSRASYVDGARVESLNGSAGGDRSSRREVTLLVRRYSDLRKLGSALLRERYHLRLRKIAPEITVKEIQTELSGSALHMRLFNMLLAGASPTLGLLTQTCLDAYGPLDLLAPFHRGAFAGWLGGLAPRYKEICSRDGRLLLLPVSVTYSFLLYNKEAIAKARASVGDLADWGAFYELLSKLRDRAGVVAPMACPDLLYLLAHFVHQGTAGLPGPGGGAPRIEWVYPKIKTGMDFFHKLVFAEKLVRPIASERELVPKLVSGAIPLCLDCGLAASALARCGETAKIGVAPLPSGPNGTPASLANVLGFFVNAKASPAEKKAAERYLSGWLEWADSEESSAWFETYGRSAGVFSSLLRPAAPRRARAEIPDDWARALSCLAETALFEHPECDWEKALAAEVFDKLFAEGTSPSPEEVALHLNANIDNAKFMEEPL